MRSYDPEQWRQDHIFIGQRETELLIPTYDPQSPYARDNADLMAIVERQNLRTWDNRE